MEKKIFVSWSTKDVRIEALAGHVTNWLQPVLGKDFRLFFSKEDIKPGALFQNQISQELKEPDFALFFISQRTARAPWVMYEFGRAHATTKDGHLFPLLFDMSVNEFSVLFSPAAGLEAILLSDSDSILRLVQQIALLAKLPPGEADAIMRRAQKSLSRLQDAIADVLTRLHLFPDRFKGMIPYNPFITDSHNFQMPEVFKYFKRNLFLVGINHNFLLNLRSDSSRFEALLQSLSKEENRRVEILISNLWNEHLREAYQMILFGEAKVELEGLDEVFTEETSGLYLDSFIKNYFVSSPDGYERLRQRLSIRLIDTLMDSFWFVDVDTSDSSGDMMLLPMTTDRGINRAAIYANKQNNPDLVEKYFGVCRGGWQSYSKSLWPNREVTIRVPPPRSPRSP